jgi:L-threonylcarbamoyladenylate synthase
MTQLLKISSESIQKAATVIHQGGLVVYPTDTVYGLGCDPFDNQAVTKLTTVKQRSKSSLPVLVASLERAKELGMIGHDIEPLVNRFWPGPLTIVVRSRADLPLAVTGPERMVGLRIPGRSDTLDLITKSGGLIIGTSANISGSSPIRDATAAFKVFDGRADIVLDGGSLGTSAESTVVRKTGPKIEILREGAVTRELIQSILSERTEPLG